VIKCGKEKPASERFIIVKRGFIFFSKRNGSLKKRPVRCLATLGVGLHAVTRRAGRPASAGRLVAKDYRLQKVEITGFVLHSACPLFEAAVSQNCW